MSGGVRQVAASGAKRDVYDCLVNNYQRLGHAMSIAETQANTKSMPLHVVI